MTNIENVYCRQVFTVQSALDDDDDDVTAHAHHVLHRMPQLVNGWSRKAANSLVQASYAQLTNGWFTVFSSIMCYKRDLH